MNRNYTTWVPPLRKDNIGLNGYATKRPMGQFDYSMQFDSFEDAASEQERLLADSKKRVEARKEKEVRRAFCYIFYLQRLSSTRVLKLTTPPNYPYAEDRQGEAASQQQLFEKWKFLQRSQVNIWRISGTCAII
jgi:hypothetical protein